LKFRQSIHNLVEHRDNQARAVTLRLSPRLNMYRNGIVTISD